MKKWAPILGLFVVLAGAGIYFRGNLQRATAEDNEVPQVPQNRPLEVSPAGRPGPKADVSKIAAWIRAQSWTNGSTLGVTLVGSYFVHNEGKVPVHNMVAEIALSYPDDPSHDKKFVVPLSTMRAAMYNGEKGVLMPDQTSELLTFNYRLGPEYWRPYRNVTVRVLEAQVFDDRSNLKEPMQLAAFIRESSPEKIIEVFKADPSLKDVTAYGIGPMQFALIQPDVSKIKAMESLGFDIAKPVRANESAYHFAIFGGPAAIDYVASRGVKGPIKSSMRYTAAHYGVYQWDPKVYAALKKAGQPIDMPDSRMVTPLLGAVDMQDPDLVKALLDLNVSLDVVDVDGKSPLVVAMQMNDAKIFKMLAVKMDIRQVSPNGNTLLHWAATFFRMQFVQYLIEKGLDKNAKNKSGQTPADIVKSMYNGRDQQVMLETIENTMPKK